MAVSGVIRVYGSGFTDIGPNTACKCRFLHIFGVLLIGQLEAMHDEGVVATCRICETISNP